MLRLVGVAAFALFCVVQGAPVSGADLPKATKKILKELRFDASILKGLERELVVPAAWIKGARAEKELKIISSWDPSQFKKLSGPFRERYPFIKFRYSRAGFNSRVIKTLIAWKQGRFVTDIVTGFGGGFFSYREANALMDLRQVPNFANLPKGMREPAGLWVGQRLRYWCLAYNTDRVKKADLPKRWEDILSNKRWHGGKIGIANRPQLWLLMLWGSKGPVWTRNYMKTFINTVKPQVRKEGTNALLSLVIAGEFDASIPSASYRTSQYVAKGAPIGWHCPEPVPLAVSEMGVLKGNPHPNASRLFVNWFLSREGQIAQFRANNAPPAHKDLRGKKFLAFPDAVVGKTFAFRGPELEHEYPKLLKTWGPLWSGRAGPEKKVKLVSFTSKITKIKRGGRFLTFKVKGAEKSIKISGRRTKVTLNGAEEDRSKLKTGMRCRVRYPKGGREAKTVACKK